MMCNIGADAAKANWVENVVTGTTGLFKTKPALSILALSFAQHSSLTQTDTQSWDCG